jgi:hypothetical protein
MLFARLKRIMRLDRLRLHGPNGARDEFHLAAATQKLRKLAKISLANQGPEEVISCSTKIPAAARFRQQPTFSTASAISGTSNFRREKASADPNWSRLLG